MNNFEWLYENDRDTLLTMVGGDCDCCKFDSYCEQGDYRCDRNWLEAEYGEPDSWEKIEGDAALSPKEYCEKHGFFDCDEYEAQNFKSFGLVYRCKDMCDVLVSAERCKH